MATYSNGLKIKLITTGDEAGTWGTSTNLNWQKINQGVVMSWPLDITNPSTLPGNSTYGSNVFVFCLADDATPETSDSAGGNARIEFKDDTANVSSDQTIRIAGGTTGALTGQSRLFWAVNNFAGDHAIIFNNGLGGTTVTLENGATALIRLDTDGNFTIVNNMGQAGGFILPNSASAFTFKNSGNTKSVVFDVTNSKIITTGMSIYSNTSFGVKANSDAGLNIYDTSDNNYAFIRATESGGTLNLRASDGDASTQPFSQITLTGTSSPKVEYIYNSGAGLVTEPMTPGFSGGLKAEYLGSITKVGSAVTPTANYQTYTFDLSELSGVSGYPASNGYTVSKTVSGTYASVPSLEFTYLLCLSAELGYAADEIVPVYLLTTDTGSILKAQWGTYSFSLSGTALSINYTFLGGSPILDLALQDRSGSPNYPEEAIDLDKWNMVTKMWF
tara:strand:- start:11922 stop:13259 length:1338 start_codon:yes stop_codon:yes gene_type:complete